MIQWKTNRMNQNLRRKLNHMFGSKKGLMVYQIKELCHLDRLKEE